jgi:hypothetical protein
MSDAADKPVVEETEPPARLRHVIDGGARVIISEYVVVICDSQGQELIRVNARKSDPLEIAIGGGSDPMRVDVSELMRMPAALAYLRGNAGLPT